MLTGIQAAHVEELWPQVAGLLQKALAKGQGDYILDDVKKELLERDAQLWAWIEDGIVLGCCTTRIVNYSQSRVCQIPLIAGTKMRKWLQCEDVIATWAREKGCTQLEGFSRDGWIRVLRHWRKAWTTMRRDL